jgi:hypothetical protein
MIWSMLKAGLPGLGANAGQKAQGKYGQTHGQKVFWVKIGFFDGLVTSHE